MLSKISLAVGALVLANFQPAVAADLPVKAPVYKAPAATPFAHRWYVEGRLGGPLNKSYDVDIGGGIGPATHKPDSGFHAAADVGIVFTPNWRAELEFTWTEGRDGEVILGGATLPHSGKTTVYTVAVNGFYTFNFNLPVHPFVGAGIGIAKYNVSNLGAVGGAFVLDDSQTSAVLALHAGIDLPITQSLTLTGRYTFAHTGSMTFASVPAGSATTRSATNDNVFTAGLRYYLN